MAEVVKANSKDPIFVGGSLHPKARSLAQDFINSFDGDRPLLDSVMECIEVEYTRLMALERRKANIEPRPESPFG